jgi:lipopolysaccharide biosynthesis regulator YciM
LLRLSELTREWERAIELHREIEKSQRGAVPAVAVAHYWCELAEQHRREKVADRADGDLRSAEATGQETVRIALLRGDLALDGGRDGEAISWFERAAKKEPALLVDVLPRLWSACRGAGQATRFTAFLRELLRQDPRNSRAVALAAVLDPGLDDAVALECLEGLLATDPTLRTLLGAKVGGSDGSAGHYPAIANIRGGLAEIARRGRSYRCVDCGYSSLNLLWQCPGCRAWDTVRPRVGLAFAFGDR